MIRAAFGPGRIDRNIMWAVVLFLLAVYLLSTALRFHSIDELAVFGVTRSLFGHGGIGTDILYWRVAELGKGTVVIPGADGHYYSIKDVLPSLLGLPLIWLARTFHASPVRAVTLVSPLVTALTGGLLYRLMRWWRYRRPVALLVALLFGVATLAWPYAETFFTQSFAALGLTLALYGTARAAGERSIAMAMVAGLGLGLALGSALPAAITMPIYPAYIVVLLTDTASSLCARLRRALPLWIAFGLGLGFILVVLGYYNWLRFDNPLQTAYQQGGAFARFGWRYVPAALFGLLLSTPRGLVWYVPLVSLVPLALWIGWHKGRRERIWLPLGQFVLLLGLLSTYDEWWGGLAWGPRLLVPAMPALVIVIAPLLDSAVHRSQWAPRLLTSSVV